MLISCVGSISRVRDFAIIESTLRGMSIDTVNEHLLIASEGEQFANAFFDRAKKIEIAQALDNFGVEYIELTSPAASEESRADCEAICKLGLKAKILTHTRCHMDDARIAVETGVDGLDDDPQLAPADGLCIPDRANHSDARVVPDI